LPWSLFVNEWHLSHSSDAWRIISTALILLPPLVAFIFGAGILIRNVVLQQDDIRRGTTFLASVGVTLGAAWLLLFVLFGEPRILPMYYHGSA